jgi:hypothetical protein
MCPENEQVCFVVFDSRENARDRVSIQQGTVCLKTCLVKLATESIQHLLRFTT